MFEYQSLGYEPIGESLDDSAGFVWRVRARGGGGGGELVLKVWQKPGSFSDDDDYITEKNLREQTLRTQIAVASVSGNWVKVERIGRVEEIRRLRYPDGVFCVQERLARSLEQVIASSPLDDERDLRAVAEGMVAGLQAWQRSAQRCHGNLKASNVLVREAPGGGIVTVALTDPAPDPGASNLDDDLRFVGQTIARLVTGRRRGAVATPRTATEEWKKFGSLGELLRNLAVLLMDGAEAPEMRLRQAARDLGVKDAPAAPAVTAVPSARPTAPPLVPSNAPAQPPPAPPTPPSAPPPPAPPPPRTAPSTRLPELIGLVRLDDASRLEVPDARAAEIRAEFGAAASQIRSHIAAIAALLPGPDVILARAAEAVQRSFDDDGPYQSVPILLACGRSAHEQTELRLHDIAAWLAAPAEDGSGRTNAAAHDLRALADGSWARDGAKGPINARTLSEWLDQARKRPTAAPPKMVSLPKILGLVTVRSSDPASYPETEKAAVDAAISEVQSAGERVRGAVRAAREAMGRDDAVIGRGAEVVQSSFDISTYSSVRGVVAGALDAHLKAAESLDQITGWLTSPAADKTGRTNRDAHDLAAIARETPAGRVLAADALTGWIERASKRYVAPKALERLPERVGFVTLAEDARPEIPEDRKPAWLRARAESESAAEAIRSLIGDIEKDLGRSDPLIARSGEAVQSAFEASLAGVDAAAVIGAAVAGHAVVKAKLESVRRWARQPAPDGSGRPNAVARDPAGFPAPKPNKRVKPEAIDAWLERAEAAAVIPLPVEPKVVESEPPAPPVPVPEKKTEAAAPVKRPNKTQVEPTPRPVVDPTPEKAVEVAGPVVSPSEQPVVRREKKRGRGVLVGVGVVGLLGAVGVGAAVYFMRAKPTTFEDAFRDPLTRLAAIPLSKEVEDVKAKGRQMYASAADKGAVAEFLEREIKRLSDHQIEPPPPPPIVEAFETVFATEQESVKSEYAGGPGESQANAAVETARAQYKADPTKRTKIREDLDAALGGIKRTFVSTFSDVDKQAVVQGVAAKQEWMDAREMQRKAWDLPATNELQVRAALNKAIEGLVAVTGTNVPFGPLWEEVSASLPWTKDTVEIRWQNNRWLEVKTAWTALYKDGVPTDKVESVRTAIAQAHQRLSSIPRVMSLTQEETDSVSGLEEALSVRLGALDTQRRNELVAYAMDEKVKPTIDFAKAREGLVALYVSAKRVKADVATGRALDEASGQGANVAPPPGVVLAQIRKAAAAYVPPITDAELGLGGLAVAANDAWPVDAKAVDALSPEFARAGWRTAIHKWTAELAGAKATSPRWGELAIAVTKRGRAAKPDAGTAAVQDAGDFSALADLLNANQPADATVHRALLEGVVSLGGPAASFGQRPILNANILMVRALADANASRDSLKASLATITANAPTAAVYPGAKKLLDRLSVQPSSAKVPDGWQSSKGSVGIDDVVTLTWGPLPSVPIGFIRLKGDKLDGDNLVYMAADEMPVSLFAAMMNKGGLGEAAGQVVNDSNKSLVLHNGPHSWIVDDRSVILNDKARGSVAERTLRPWLLGATGEADMNKIGVINNLYADQGGSIPRPPNANSPAQPIYPALASELLSKVSTDGAMHLPTAAQWRAALDQSALSADNDGAGGAAFVQGQCWPPVLCESAAAVFDLFKAPIGKPIQINDAGNAAYVTWFRDTEPNATQFRNLCGNVAELVQDGSKFGVMGWSAFAPPPSKGARPPLDPLPLDGGDVRADLGIRLAFSTPPAQAPAAPLTDADLLVRGK